MLEISDTGYWIDKTGNYYNSDMKLAAGLASFFKKEKAKSIVDMGCGFCVYLRHFIEEGLNCDGFDGNPFTEELSNNLGKVLDLSLSIEFEKKYDWVLSLEVGEHIPKEYESVFIENLHKNNTKGIVLSWAVKGQGGEGHVNEQDNYYIKNIFQELNYKNDLETENKLRKLPVAAPNAQSGHVWFKDTLMVFRK